jgi:hypothetical protein
MRATAKLDPYFERISRLAARRLKREIERRGTLGAVCTRLEPEPNLKRIPTEESASDLFRSDGPDAPVGELLERFKALGICASRAGVTAALAELEVELETLSLGAG